MAIALPSSRSPVPSFGRFATFGRATAGYVDRSQAATGSPHRPGTASETGRRSPPPFHASAGDPTLITPVLVHTWPKSRVLSIETRECDFPGITIHNLNLI